MQKMSRFIVCSALLLGLSVAKTASAESMDYFTVTEAATSTSIQFELPSNPTVGEFSTGSTTFEFSNVGVSFDGISTTANIWFGSTELYMVTAGGLQQEFDIESSPIMYTGTLSNPTSFNIGTFNGVDDSHTGDPVVVTINPVPEPGTLALLGTGALGLAGVVRRRFSL